MDKKDIIIALFLILNISVFFYTRYETASTPALVQVAQTEQAAQQQNLAGSLFSNFIYITSFLAEGTILAGMLTSYIFSKKLGKELTNTIAIATCVLLASYTLMIIVPNGYLVI